MVPAIAKKKLELQELIVDLNMMHYEPWNLWAETTLRKFLFGRGNYWIRTMRQDPGNWTAEV